MTRIVVLGAGYAGLMTAVSLAGRLRDLGADERITAVHNVANPDKLRAVAARTVHRL